jgi:hypothetical protein
VPGQRIEALDRGGESGGLRCCVPGTAGRRGVKPDRPGVDTVTTLEWLALLEIYNGGSDADRLSAEALDLGQALDIGDARLAGLLITRGIGHSTNDRTARASAAFKHAADLAARTGDQLEQGRALLNLADVLAGFDPQGAAVAALKAAELLRRVGAREYVAVAVANLCEVWLSTGEWHEAAQALTAAIDADGLEDQNYIQVQRGRLAALRGEYATATAVLDGLPRLHASEDAQDRAALLLVEAEVAQLAGDAVAALERARRVVDYAKELGIRAESVRWSWPLAVRIAHTLGDHAAERDLLAVLDAHPIGHVPLILRAEADLARARLATDREAAGALFDRGIGALRRIPAPYHLAHALLDQAVHLRSSGEHDAAETAVSEAGEIAERLHATPLAKRARDANDRLTATTSEVGHG